MYPSLFELLVRNGVDRDTAHQVIARIRRGVRSRRPLSAPVARLLREARVGVAPMPGLSPGSAVRLYTAAQAADARAVLPTPDTQTGFPYPTDRSGDVKQRDWSPSGADSEWLDLGSPVGVFPGSDLVWSAVSPLELRVLTRAVMDWR